MTGAEFTGQLVRARDGDPEAWSQIFDSLAPIVYSYLRGQSLDDPDDVAGETFLQVVRDLNRFEGSERQFRSWVLTIAHHRMLDARRARTRRPTQPMPNGELPETRDSEDASDGLLADVEWAAISRRLDDLTEDQRAVVLLRVAADLTLDEAADVLGRSVGAVKALQHRAFSALREQLADSRNSLALRSAHPVWRG